MSKPSAPPPSPVLTPQEAGVYLGLDRLGSPDPAATVRRWAMKGELGYVIIGGHMAFLADQLDLFLSSRRKGAGGR